MRTSVAIIYTIGSVKRVATPSWCVPWKSNKLGSCSSGTVYSRSLSRAAWSWATWVPIFDTGYSMFDVRCSIFDIRCSACNEVRKQ